MYRHHNKTSYAEETETGKVNMSGKVCMVTGANSGLGYQVSLILADMGAIVVLVCRNKHRGEEARKRIIAATGNEHIELLVADLSSQESIRELVDHFKSRHQRLHVLVNNAGHISWNRQETIDGLEMAFAVNHLAPFLLTNLLLGPLQKAAESDGEGRVVNISSSAQRSGKINLADLQSTKRYHIMEAYAASKLALVITSKEFAHRLQGTGITVNCVGPGHMRTTFNSKAGGLSSIINTFPLSRWLIQNILEKPVAEAVVTPIYLVTSPELKGCTGLFYGDYCQPETPSRHVKNRELARQLWDISAQLTHISPAITLKNS
jgi:NAD(P)-dependent dehydrogenase (short-subunit alcohol dehydrogenase family)